MPRYRCVERCFWNGQFYSPAPDGKNEYDGELTPPESKKGKKYFVCLDAPVAAPKVEVQEYAPVATPKEPTREWEFRRMSKHDLLVIMETKYKTKVDGEAITRDALIQMIMEKAAAGETSQEQANVLKG